MQLDPGISVSQFRAWGRPATAELIGANQACLEHRHGSLAAGLVGIIVGTVVSPEAFALLTMGEHFANFVHAARSQAVAYHLFQGVNESFFPGMVSPRALGVITPGARFGAITPRCLFPVVQPSALGAEPPGIGDSF